MHALRCRSEAVPERLCAFGPRRCLSLAPLASHRIENFRAQSFGQLVLGALALRCAEREPGVDEFGSFAFVPLGANWAMSFTG